MRQYWICILSHSEYHFDFKKKNSSYILLRRITQQSLHFLCRKTCSYRLVSTSSNLLTHWKRRHSLKRKRRTGGRKEMPFSLLYFCSARGKGTITNSWRVLPRLCKHIYHRHKKGFSCFLKVSCMSSCFSRIFQWINVKFNVGFSECSSVRHHFSRSFFVGFWFLRVRIISFAHTNVFDNNDDIQKR